VTPVSPLAAEADADVLPFNASMERGFKFPFARRTKFCGRQNVLQMTSLFLQKMVAENMGGRRHSSVFPAGKQAIFFLDGTEIGDFRASPAPCCHQWEGTP
jgi:hypothetical protein